MEKYFSVEPEQSNIYEVEVGRVLTDKMFLVLNLFDMSFDKVIVYQSDNSGIGS